jgi:hypothetical protein
MKFFRQLVIGLVCWAISTLDSLLILQEELVLD